MPQRKLALKALRKTRKHRIHNLIIKTTLKKTVKGFMRLVQEKKTDEARAQLKVLYKKFDKATKVNLLHKNTAARRKARFTRLFQTISQP